YFAAPTVEHHENRTLRKRLPRLCRKRLQRRDARGWYLQRQGKAARCSDAHAQTGKGTGADRNDDGPQIGIGFAGRAHRRHDHRYQMFGVTASKVQYLAAEFPVFFAIVDTRRAEVRGAIDGKHRRADLFCASECGPVRFNPCGYGPESLGSVSIAAAAKPCQLRPALPASRPPASRKGKGSLTSTPVSRLQFQPPSMQDRLSITVRLHAPLEHEIAGGLEGDRRFEIGGHGAIERIALILPVDDGRHPLPRLHHAVLAAAAVMQPVRNGLAGAARP